MAATFFVTSRTICMRHFSQSAKLEQSVARKGRRSAAWPELNCSFMVTHLLSMSCAFSSLRAMVV